MNDNLHSEGPCHAYALDLLNNLYVVLGAARKAGVEFANCSEDMAYGLDFGFWENECAKALNLAHKSYGGQAA